MIVVVWARLEYEVERCDLAGSVIIAVWVRNKFCRYAAAALVYFWVVFEGNEMSELVSEVSSCFIFKRLY